MTGAERRVVGMSAGLREEPVLADNNSATLTTRSRQARANGQGSPADRLGRSCRMPQMPVRHGQRKPREFAAGEDMHVGRDRCWIKPYRTATASLRRGS